MKFAWDEEKNATNMQKHGFDFADGEDLLDGQSPFWWRRMRTMTTAKTDGAELE